MRLMSRFCETRLWLLFSILQLPVLFAQASGQEKPARNEISPWQRVLKGEDAKRVEELEKKIDLKPMPEIDSKDRTEEIAG